MNRYFLLFFLMFVSLNLCAQVSKLNSIIDKYSGMKGVESVEISPSLLHQLSGGKTTDSLIRNISFLKILTVDIKVSSAIKLEINDALKVGFSKLMSVNSSGSMVDIYLADNNKVLLSIINDNKEYVLMYMSGSITKYVIDSVLSGKIKIK